MVFVTGLRHLKSLYEGSSFEDAVFIRSRLHVVDDWFRLIIGLGVVCSTLLRRPFCKIFFVNSIISRFTFIL